jgi:hypothetical protein
MKIKLFSTIPSKKDPFWQLILFPNITILRSPDKEAPYTVVGFEWLFWSVSIIINDKTGVSAS